MQTQNFKSPVVRWIDHRLPVLASCHNCMNINAKESELLVEPWFSCWFGAGDDDRHWYHLGHALYAAC